MFNRSIASYRRPGSPRTAPVAGASALVAMVALCAVSPGRAHANLVITPTFDPKTIINDPNAAAIEGTINSAITDLESHISTPITVSVFFQDTNPGGGFDNTTAQFFAPYGPYTDPSTGSPIPDYYDKLKAVDTAPGATSAQKTAFASLGPAPTVQNPGSPVNGNLLIGFTTPNARALGFSTSTSPQISASDGNSYDSVIDIDPTNSYPPKPNNGSNYSLKAETLHELDEVLGIGGGGSSLQPTDQQPDFVGPLDLYRYSAKGVRSFSTSAKSAYFSIDGGYTVLSDFNQNVNGGTEDYGDWLSFPAIPPGYGPQVQDAYAYPGNNPDLGVNELTALNVIGYDLAVPEPASGTLLLALGTAFLVRRRRSSPTAG